MTTGEMVCVYEHEGKLVELRCGLPPSIIRVPLDHPDGPWFVPEGEKYRYGDDTLNWLYRVYKNTGQWMNLFGTIYIAFLPKEEKV